MSAFSDFVQKMQDRTFEALPYGQWNDLRWPLKTNQSASDPHRRAVIFTPEEGATAGFSEPFATLARALICNLAASRLFLGSASPFLYLMAALRLLYAAVPQGIGPEDISEEHFVAAEGLARHHYSAAKKRDGFDKKNVSMAAVNVAVKLEWIVEALARHRITPTLEWTRTLRQPSETDEKSEKLLTDEQAMAWAELSARDMSSIPYDRIRQRLVDLMMCTGFRVNEVCTLPRDTLVKEERINEDGAIALDASGEPIIWTGLRYWPEKGGSGQTCVKPIPTVMVPIVERAVEEILRDTSRAHASAEAHAKNQSPFQTDPRWAQLPPDHEMWPEEVAAMLRLKGNMVVRGREFIANYDVSHKIVPDKRGTRTYHLERVTKAAVEAALRKASFLGDCVPRERGEVSLHECLFVLPVAIRSDRPGFTGSSRLITDLEILSFLGGQTKFASAFARYGIAVSEENKFLPSQARSWLTTIASEEAIHPLDIARWMGWTKVESVAPYDLRSRKKREASARRDLMGAMDASTLRQRAPLGPTEEAFADDVAGHVTSIGICRATFDEDPCAFLSAGLASGRWQEGVAAMTPEELAGLILRLKRLVTNATIALKDDVKAKTWLTLTLKLLEKAEALSAAKQGTDRWAS